jgi:hypothetical protein
MDTIFLNGPPLLYGHRPHHESPQVNGHPFFVPLVIHMDALFLMHHSQVHEHPFHYGPLQVNGQSLHHAPFSGTWTPSSSWILSGTRTYLDTLLISDLLRYAPADMVTHSIMDFLL